MFWTFRIVRWFRNCIDYLRFIETLLSWNSKNACHSAGISTPKRVFSPTSNFSPPDMCWPPPWSKNGPWEVEEDGRHDISAIQIFAQLEERRRLCLLSFIRGHGTAAMIRATVKGWQTQTHRIVKLWQTNLRLSLVPLSVLYLTAWPPKKSRAVLLVRTLDLQLIYTKHGKNSWVLPTPAERSMVCRKLQANNIFQGHHEASNSCRC